MQLLHNFSGMLAALFVLALAYVGVTVATPLTPSTGEDEAATVSTEGICKSSLYSDLRHTTNQMPTKPATYLVSHEQMMHWIANTDAKLTFVGAPINPLTPPSAQVTTVTYCNTVLTDDCCGGSCTVYTGGATCLNVPGTNCLAATNNVVFCSSGGCTGATCKQLTTCGVLLANGFCLAPSTQSILVSGF